MSQFPSTERAKFWQQFTPKLITTLREGYDFSKLRADAIAGLTVAIVALPLSMALGIASGTTPGNGLITAAVAGFFISALGGSRVQIGGPTAAFVVLLYHIIEHHGYEGLVISAVMAGLMLIAAGAFRLGTWIKYIPGPVVTGFTSGIAVSIFSGQIKDIFGLTLTKVPADFLPKWEAFWNTRHTMNPTNLAVAVGAIAIIIVMKKYLPKWPGFLIAVGATSLATWGLHLPIDTIGSRFGGIPHSLPIPAFPHFNFQEAMQLLPSAMTIAFLAGIESLLSAVVADGMSGTRHRSNIELIAQGVASIASAIFGGIPATGAIARTATNIRSGGRTPMAGIIHAVFLLLFILFFSHLANFIPLASLAAVLVIVAWNMSEREHFLNLMSAPMGDRVVLLITFALTVLVDLTTAIGVGMVVASILFMHRMAETVTIKSHSASEWLEDNEDGPEEQPAAMPKGVRVFQIHGPLFFGATGALSDLLSNIEQIPNVFVLRMKDVPLMDASGVWAIKSFVHRCNHAHCKVVLTELQEQPREILISMGVPDKGLNMEIVNEFNPLSL